MISYLYPENNVKGKELCNQFLHKPGNRVLRKFNFLLLCNYKVIKLCIYIFNVILIFRKEISCQFIVS